MSDDSAELHVKVRHRNRPPKPYKWEIYRGNDPICIERAMHGYPTQQAAANAGEKALRFLESEALKQEQGIMADKHFKPPEPPNDNAKSIDRWDDAAATQCANAPEDRPATLPLGRAKFTTRPVLTGSPAPASTIGMTCFAARTLMVPPPTMTSIFSRPTR